MAAALTDIGKVGTYTCFSCAVLEKLIIGAYGALVFWNIAQTCTLREVLVFFNLSISITIVGIDEPAVIDLAI